MGGRGPAWDCSPLLFLSSKGENSNNLLKDSAEFLKHTHCALETGGNYEIARDVGEMYKAAVTVPFLGEIEKTKHSTS